MGPCLLQNYNLLKIDGLRGQFQIYSIGCPCLFTSIQRQFGGKQLRQLLHALDTKCRHCFSLNRMCCTTASILKRPPFTIVRGGKGHQTRGPAFQMGFGREVEMGSPFVEGKRETGSQRRGTHPESNSSKGQS